MLRSLDLLGYAVEWRVINAADYGMPQRRRRVFLLGYHKRTATYKALAESRSHGLVGKRGHLGQGFPVLVRIEPWSVHFSIAQDLDVLIQEVRLEQRASRHSERPVS